MSDRVGLHDVRRVHVHDVGERRTRRRAADPQRPAAAPASPAAATATATGDVGAAADRRRRRAKTGETETPADRLFQRTADAPGRVVHGQPVLEQGQTHRPGPDAEADRETDQNMVPEQAHEREEVQERFG